MIPESLSCPYCNTTLRLTSPAGQGQRIRCPRCHELIQGNGEEGITASDYRPTIDLFRAGHPPGDFNGIPPGPRAWSNRQVARAVLGVMFAMAALGLAFAWATREFRRQNDHLDSAAEQLLPPVVPVAPAELEALAYLPDDLQVIAGIHVAELMDNPGGRLLLPNFQIPALHIHMKNLQETIGLRLEDIDHVVLGLQVNPNDFPHPFLVVQTRQVYSRDRLRVALQSAKPAGSKEQKLFYTFSPREGLKGFRFSCWCVSERTFIITLDSPRDMAGLSATPNRRRDRIAPALQELFRNQLGVGTQVWLAGHSHDWKSLIDPPDFLGVSLSLFPKLPLHEREALETAQTFGAWLQFDGRIRGTLKVDCGSPEAAAAFNDYLATKQVTSPDLQKFFGDERPRAITKDFIASAKRVQKENWVTVTAEVPLQGFNLKRLSVPIPVRPPAPPATVAREGKPEPTAAPKASSAATP
jgi:hypothetical protein